MGKYDQPKQSNTSAAEETEKSLIKSAEQVHKIYSDLATMRTWTTEMQQTTELLLTDSKEIITELNKALDVMTAKTQAAADEMHAYFEAVKKGAPRDTKKEAKLEANYSKSYEAKERLNIKTNDKGFGDCVDKFKDVTANLGKLTSGGIKPGTEGQVAEKTAEKTALEHIMGTRAEKGTEVGEAAVSSTTAMANGAGNVGEILNEFKGMFKGMGGKIAAALKIMEMIGSVANKLNESVDSATALLEESGVKKLDSRLYGLLDQQKGINANFVELVEDATEIVGTSPLMKTTDLINNIVALGNEGIAFNLEQRALWATLSDKMVSTFEVTNATLLQLVKLQQAELTDTYMGVEASITRALNSMYKDTQYLNSTFDSVYTALLDTLSSVSTDLGASIAYQVQLWLGSLSSLGLSDSAATAIATSINNLLTGDLSSMSEEGKKLLAMAASNAGISYADLLVSGVEDGKTMNSLLASMVDILQQIYESSEDNNAVLSAWGDVFGFELSDWKAISNLNENYIKTLTQSQSILNYNQASAKDEVAFISNNLVSQRVLTSERVNNMINNAMFQLGWDIASDQAKYITWQVAKTAKDLASMFPQNIFSTIIVAAATIAQVIDMLPGMIDTLGDVANAVPTMFDENVAAPNQMVLDANTIITQLFEMQQSGGQFVDLNEAGQTVLKRSSYYTTRHKSYWGGVDYSTVDIPTLTTDMIDTNTSSGESASGKEETSNPPTGTTSSPKEETNNTSGADTSNGQSEGETSSESTTPESSAGSTSTVTETPALGANSETTESKDTVSSTAKKTEKDLNSAQSMDYYATTSGESVSNVSDKAAAQTFDITELYTLLATGEGARVRLVAIEDGVKFPTPTWSGSLTTQSSIAQTVLDNLGGITK